MVVMMIAGQNASAQKVMKPGGWEFVSDITVSAKDGSQRTGQSKTSVCFTKALLAREIYLDPKYEEGQMVGKGGTCAVFDFKKQGSSATWNMSCNMPRGVKVEMFYKNSASETDLISEVTQTIISDPKGTEVLTLIKAQYVGECTSEMKTPEVQTSGQTPKQPQKK